jgi:hypothetical protein
VLSPESNLLNADEDIGSRQGEITMNEKLASLRKIVEEPSKQEITMVYLDEESALQCVALPIDGDEPSTDEWIMLREKAESESFRVFEVLSTNGGTVIVPDGPVLVGTPDDGTLLQALRLADAKREYYFSSRR